MSKFQFRGIRSSATHTDWMFAGPDTDKEYGLSVDRRTGGYYGYQQPAGAPDDRQQMPIDGPDTRELVALTDRAANPVSRALDRELCGIADGGTDDRAAIGEAIRRLEKTSGLLGELYDASKQMLDAYGGDVPDWLRGEAIKVENALIALRLAAPPIEECEPASAPAPGPN